MYHRVFQVGLVAVHLGAQGDHQGQAAHQLGEIEAQTSLGMTGGSAWVGTLETPVTGGNFLVNTSTADVQKNVDVVKDAIRGLMAEARAARRNWFV